MPVTAWTARYEALLDAVERRAAVGWVAEDAARAALVAARDSPAAAPDQASTRLADLARHAGLDLVETALLAVAAVAEESVAGHLLLGLLSGDTGPARPTVALALELAGVAADAETAYRLLGDLAPLRRCGLVELGGDDVLLSRRVGLPPRVAAHLAGSDAPTPEVLAVLVEPTPVQVDGVSVAADAIVAGLPLTWIHGPAGTAGTALGVAACQTLDVPCLVADLQRAPDGESVQPLVSALLLEAVLGGAVLVLAGAERARPDWFAPATLPVVAVSTEPWDPSWSADLPVTIAAPRLTLAERARLWAPVLGRLDVDREISALRFGPEQIVSVGRHARQMARLHGEPDVDLGRIRSSARHLGRGRALRTNPDAAVGIDDLVLPEHALGEIRRLLDWGRYRDEVIGLGPVHGRGGKGTGICALFTGPPGTGKTLAAHVVADSLGMDLYQVELAGVVDKYIGETEKNLEQVFAIAESTNAVLFFDEADALFGSRSEVRDARDRYANQEIAYLLQRMEQFDGITVLASNLRGNIDPAFARRLQFIISFPEPDEATRARLWRRHLAALGDEDGRDPVDVDTLARTVELSGGDIRNIVLAATYAAVADGERVGMRHLNAAVRREYIKLGRRVPAGPVDADHTPVAASRPRSRSGDRP